MARRRLSIVVLLGLGLGIGWEGTAARDFRIGAYSGAGSDLGASFSMRPKNWLELRSLVGIGGMEHLGAPLELRAGEKSSLGALRTNCGLEMRAYLTKSLYFAGGLDWVLHGISVSREATDGQPAMTASRRFNEYEVPLNVGLRTNVGYKLAFFLEGGYRIPLLHGDKDLALSLSDSTGKYRFPGSRPTLAFGFTYRLPRQ